MSKTFIPPLRMCIPTITGSCKIMTPNTLHYMHELMMDNGFKWWPTPPESPDAKPIEKLWHEMKEYIKREVKHKNKTELMKGIKQFWRY